MGLRKFLFAATLGLSGMAAGVPTTASAQIGDIGAWTIAITPRVQYQFLNFNASISPNRFESAAFPFYGGTIEVSPPSSQFSFLVTVMDGTDYNLWFKDGAGTKIGQADIHRLDVEALLRYRVEGTGLSLFGGFRFIRQRVTTTLTVPNFIFFDTGTPVFDNRIHFYLAEVGAGYAHALDSQGEHVIFANGVVGIGKSRAVDNRINGSPFNLFAVTFDVNAGYNWQFSSCCAFQARYRAFVFPAGNKTFKDLAVAHGPEVGLTVRFSLF